MIFKHIIFIEMIMCALNLAFEKKLITLYHLIRAGGFPYLDTQEMVTS